MGVMKTLTINGTTYRIAHVVPTLSVTLLANAWVKEGDAYSQVVWVEGVTSRSKVDLQPTREQLEEFHYKILAFVAENDGGIVTVYAIGDKPDGDHTIQITLTEVEGTGKIRGNTVGTTMPRTNFNQTDRTQADYLEGREKIVQSVNGISPDANGNINITTGEGGSTGGSGDCSLLVVTLTDVEGESYKLASHSKAQIEQWISNGGSVVLESQGMIFQPYEMPLDGDIDAHFIFTRWYESYVELLMYVIADGRIATFTRYTINFQQDSDGGGVNGKDGRGIVSILRTSGNGSAGTVDVYTITYTDNTTSTFSVRHGTNGTNYVLTDADKADIAELAAALVPTGGGGSGGSTSQPPMVVTCDSNTYQASHTTQEIYDHVQAGGHVVWNYSGELIPLTNYAAGFAWFTRISGEECYYTQLVISSDGYSEIFEGSFAPTNKTEIVNSVLAALPTWTGGSY